MSASQYDIAAKVSARFRALATGKHADDPMESHFANRAASESLRFSEQSRLQAAFCEAYEAELRHYGEEPEDEYSEEHGKWDVARAELENASHSAWAALQNHINGDTR